MKYISMDEYLMSRIRIENLTSDQLLNMNTLVPKVNELLEHFGEYRLVTSGYRSIEDQKRINPKSMNSAHLSCQAVDLEDKDGKLNSWLKNNIAVLVELELYCEERQGPWQHIQCRPVKSGKRFFIP